MSNEKLEAVIADMRETFQNTHYLIPVGKLVERAFRAGIEQEEPAGDWHNLTEAIADGEPIDFEKLDGRKVRFACNKHSAETVLELDLPHVVEKPAGWECFSYDNFRKAWYGQHGWTLWLDGEIPMRKQTADELPFGTEFRGKQEGRTLTGVSRYVRVAGNSAQNLDRGHGSANEYARSITVYEVIGIYGQKESE